MYEALHTLCFTSVSEKNPQVTRVGCRDIYRFRNFLRRVINNWFAFALAPTYVHVHVWGAAYIQSGVVWCALAPCRIFRQRPLRGSRSEAALPDAPGFSRFKSFKKALWKPISKLEVNRARSINQNKSEIVNGLTFRPFSKVNICLIYLFIFKSGKK